MAGVLKIVDGEEDLSYFQQHQIVYAYIKPEQNGLSGQDLEQLILERRVSSSSLVEEEEGNDFSQLNGFGLHLNQPDQTQWQEQTYQDDIGEPNPLSKLQQEDDQEIVYDSSNLQQQEVLVYDEESGEYQKYLYITDGSEQEQEKPQNCEDLEQVSSKNDERSEYQSATDEPIGQQQQVFVTEEETENFVYVQEHEERQEEARDEQSSDYLAQLYQTNQVEENEDSVPEIIYQHCDQQQQKLQHAPEQFTIVESVSALRKRKHPSEESGVVTTCFSRSETPSSSATWVECDKCQRRIKLDEFASHYREVHVELSTAEKTAQFKKCSLCNKLLSRKDYLTHFKETHAEVRLGCPKCPQTYHSPELLNVHYRHFHMQQPQAPATTSVPFSAPKVILNKLTEEKVIRCPTCSALVPDLAEHNAEKHKPRTVTVTPGPSSNSSQVRRGGVLTLRCDVCNKSYHSQREFTNHRRRKDFCKPPIVEEPPTPKRRIGIIRRSL